MFSSEQRSARRKIDKKYAPMYKKLKEDRDVEVVTISCNLIVEWIKSERNPEIIEKFGLILQKTNDEYISKVIAIDKEKYMERKTAGCY
jgi:hypothetical protein